MNYLYLRLLVSLQNLMASERGQDLVEYALLACLIALAAIGGMRGVASAVTGVFTRVSSTLA